MPEIAAAAGVSVGLMYRYFKGKEELATATLGAIEGLGATTADPQEALGLLPVREHHSDWAALPRLLYQSLRCERWSTGRVVLIGDGAYAMSPDLGQGANTALRDALALVLNASAAAPDELEVALSAFERSRRPLVERIQRRGYREGRAATRQRPGSFAATTWALRLMRLAPAVSKRAEIRLMSGLRRRRGLDLRSAGVDRPFGRTAGRRRRR